VRPSLELLFGVAVAVGVGALVVALGLGHLGLRAPGAATRLYARHFRDPRRERLFLSSLSFFLTFFVVRAITYAIRYGVGPFHNVEAGGVHVHHLVWGILLLLAIGYAWLAQVGTGVGNASVWASRITALLYGTAAALTLDEFALWLRLKDVYWTREGRESVDAVVIFGGFLSVGVWGAPFFHALLRESVRLLRR
jgi:hypothetical protein